MAPSSGNNASEAGDRSEIYRAKVPFMPAGQSIRESLPALPPDGGSDGSSRGFADDMLSVCSPGRAHSFTTPWEARLPCRFLDSFISPRK